MDLGKAVIVFLQFLYLLWPLLVVAFLYWKNRSRIHKQISFLAASAVANFALFSVGVVAFLGLSSFIAALTTMNDDSVMFEFLILVIGLAGYVFVLSLHVVVGQYLVKKWAS